MDCNIVIFNFMCSLVFDTDVTQAQKQSSEQFMVVTEVLR